MAPTFISVRVPRGWKVFAGGCPDKILEITVDWQGFVKSYLKVDRKLAGKKMCLLQKLNGSSSASRISLA